MGYPEKTLSQPKTDKSKKKKKKKIHDCTVTKLLNIKDRDSDLWKYLLISNIPL